MASRIIVLAIAALLAGCATGPNADPRDPLEPLNRSVGSFNHGVDQAVLKPTATAYRNGVPDLARSGVSHFFGNLGDAWSAINSTLQLKLGDAAENLIRFNVNTFFGLGGLVDFATEFGIERHKEDMGTTLAHWGVPPGPYLVLPLFGPSTLRDALALPVDWIGDPVFHVSPGADRATLLVTRAEDTRVKLLPLDPILDSAIDPYLFTRDAYLQYRMSRTTRADEKRADAEVGTEPPSSP